MQKKNIGYYVTIRQTGSFNPGSWGVEVGRLGKQMSLESVCP